VRIGKAVVLDGHVPEERADLPRDAREIAGEPAGEVDEVDALIEHLAAAGDGRIGAPFAVIAQSARRGRSGRA
jgi:hypothetical protein